jgi:class 3 adenylate cyclase/tetratricopeptide (TPR) repeat protein
MGETPAVTTLARYVPSVALAWPGSAATGELPLHRCVDGTLMFIDVSGFTALSERLAQRGKVGAEQLTDVLNAVFGHMLGLAATRGGTLLKFGGDALFLLYTGPDHPVQAASSAVELRAALAQATKTPGPAGRLHLRMSVGVHTGMVDLFLVGSSHRELVVAGPATTAVAAMEAAASAGQILLSPATAQRLPAGAVGEALGPGRLLRWRAAHAPLPIEDPDAAPPHDAGRFVPTALRELLGAAEPESEHRTAGVAFLRYAGLDALLARDPQDAADALGTLVTTAQLAADEQGVTFLATDLAEDGGKIILVAGFPVTAEDDQGRLLRAACDVVATASRQSWPLAVEAGVNRGHVFAGAVGSAQRATVTVMGDTVNLAARVMAKAEPGCVLATPAVLDSAQTLFATEPVEPFMVKGKSRPVTAYLVGDETGTRPPRGLGALPFLGRDDELAVVCEALQAVCDGHGGTLAVTGDAGMGKSRLLAEALSSEPSVTVLDVRAEPYGAATPYRPIRDPVRRLLGLTHVDVTDMPDALTATLERLAPALLPWAPLLGDVVGVPIAATEATRDLDPQFRPERTAAVVIDLMAATVPGGLVVAFDDAHYSDEATAALMSRLERETSSRPWLLLCSLREGESGGYRPLGGVHVPLPPLSDDAARALVQHGTQAAPLRPHDVETVVARAAGNPLFLEETLRNLRDHGDLDSLPSSLEGMVAAQIDALPPLARRLVRRASVLGRSFRVGVLADLFDNEPVALDDATRKELSDILEEDGKGRLRFRHALLRDAAYDSLPYEQRRELHLRAAASTLKRAESNPAALADTLALHYAAGGDWASTWRWALAAAEQARAAFAVPEAAAQYQRALDAARRLPGVSPADVVGTWRSLGEVRSQIGRFEESLDAYRQGVRAATRPADKAELIARMAAAKERAGRYRAAHQDLTRAEGLARDDGKAGDEVMLAVQVGRAVVYLAQERFVEGERQAQRAVSAARAAGDEVMLARSLNVLATAEVMLGELAAGRHWEEALAIRERRGELAEEADITGNLGGLAWFEGRWDDARDLYQQSAEAATRAGSVVQAALARANLGELLVAQGRLDEAAAALGDSISTLRAVGYTEGAIFAESQLGRAEAMRGDLDAARARMTRLLDEVGGTKPTVAVDLASALAEAEAEVGDPQNGLDVLEEALAAAGGHAGVYTVAADRVRGRALARLGRYAESASVLANAISEAEASRLGYERALLRLAEEELAQLSGHAPSAEQISQAELELTELGVTPERLRALVASALSPARN